MASIKHIVIVIGISALLVTLIGWWIGQKNQAPELLLTGDNAQLKGPLSPKELEANNPAITNDMNRIATIKTNKGDIKLELFEDTMPITTGNFIKLAEEGFYNNTKFHRIIDGFMIQAGDPNTKGDDVATYGTGGPGYTIQDEFVEGPLLTNVRGTIAMANTGQPNSGGSQFFINTVDNTGLDFDKPPMTSSHPVFGRVVDGMDIIDVISKAPTRKTLTQVAIPPAEQDIPIDPVVVESITIAPNSQN